MWLGVFLLAGFVTGCGGGASSSSPVAASSAATLIGVETDPAVQSSSPPNNATHVPTSQNNGTATQVTAFFSQAMDPATIKSSPAGTRLTFTLRETSGTNVPGTVAMNVVGSVATFTPTAPALMPNTSYTATLTTAARSADGSAMTNPVVWTFVTSAVASIGRVPVNLGSAGNFAILANAGVATVPGARVTGDIGVSPISTGVKSGVQTPLSGFLETMDSTNAFSTSGQVVGKIYTADYTPPTPTLLTTAVGDMEIAYTDAAERSLPDFTELGAGEIGGVTPLAPGLYKWSTGVSISNDVKLSGTATDVWIFQIDGDLTQASGTNVILLGGARAKNVFWQVAGRTGVNIGTNAHFEGVMMAKKAINLGTGASANSRLMAQASVNLQQSVVTQPAP
jgi:hypothetical protein